MLWNDIRLEYKAHTEQNTVRLTLLPPLAVQSVLGLQAGCMVIIILIFHVLYHKKTCTHSDGRHSRVCLDLVRPEEPFCWVAI